MPENPAPEHVAETCLAFAVNRAARRIARAYDDAFRPLGITSGQFSILVSISAGRPLGVGKLSDELGMDRTTFTAAIKPLERDGLVEGLADPADARGRHFRLTPQGRALLDDAFPVWVKLQAHMQERAPALDLDRLRRDLRVLA